MQNDRRLGERRSARQTISIRTRLMALALLAVVPLVINDVRSVEADRRASIEAAHREALNLARRGAESQKDVFEAARAFLGFLARIYPQYRSDQAACSRFLADVVAGLPWAKSFAIADQGGRVVCAATPASIGLDIADRPHFQRAVRDGGFAVSDYSVGRRVNVPTVFATYADPASKGPVEAVFIALMDLNWIGRLAEAAASRSGSVVLMTDGQGTVLTRYPDPEKWVGRSVIDHPLVTHMLLRSEGIVTESGLDGVRRVFGFVKLPDTETRFAVGLDEGEVLRHVNTEASIAYTHLAAISALLLAALWFGGEWLITRPIRSLAAAAQRVGRGEVGVRVGDKSWTAEFAPLAVAMDDMASTLAQREGQLRQSNNHLEELARLDGLTGLVNRRAFDADLEAEWQRAVEFQFPLALLMIDVDHFKLFNDTNGHVEGDDCLRMVGRVLTLAAKGESGLAARYGGEEFIVLLPNVTGKRASEIAQRIRVAVEELDIRHSAAKSGCVTVSIGVASTEPPDMVGPEELLYEADANVYAAKRRGRNMVVAQVRAELLDVS
jgi:diguanylate cyclase (GGDEF)-like protein